MIALNLPTHFPALRGGNPGNSLWCRCASTLRTAVCLLALVVLAACETQPGRPVGPAAGPAAGLEDPRSVSELLRAAENATPTQADALRLLAAERALDALNTPQAQKIIDLVRRPPAATQRQQYALVNARLETVLGNNQGALRWLDDPSLTQQPLTTDQQLRIGQLRARIFLQMRSYLASARERTFYDNLLQGDEQSANREAIFNALMSLPASLLIKRAQSAMTEDLRGWIALAAAVRQHQADPEQQLQAINDWRRTWPGHPAATQLPAGLELLTEVIRDQPKNIALLLPMQGDLGVYGRAIRDGILASHYHTQGPALIRVYDTSRQDVRQLLNIAASNGAELVIGPLNRDNVTLLAAQTQLPVPVLALNRSITSALNPQLYQFGLAPEDEILQVAQQAYDDGQRNALMIFPMGDWGKRNAATFERHWQELGGNISDTAQYASQRDYSDMVKTLMNIDESEARASMVQRIIGQSVEFTPRRRQDTDFIFLLANPDQARGINPTLAFFYAEDIPVYATSHVYEFSDSRIESIDLNGIRFNDIPWKLAGNHPIQQQIESSWPDTRSRLAAFYALGVDAYQLHPRLQQLKAIPNQQLYGVTGVLTLTPDNIINRHLMWAQFTNGKVVTMPEVADPT